MDNCGDENENKIKKNIKNDKYIHMNRQAS